MTIMPFSALTSFPSPRKVSLFNNEEEILLPVHTVFRIIEIQLARQNGNVWKLQAIFTNNENPKLSALTQYIR